MDRDLERLSTFLEKLVRSAGDVALSHFDHKGTPYIFKTDGAERALSIADQQADEILVQGIRAQYPEDGVVSEEEEHISAPPEYHHLFSHRLIRLAR